MFRDKYEKKAAKVLILLCLVYSILGFSVGVGVTSLLNDLSKIFIFFESFGVLLLLHYLFYYGPNIRAHRKLEHEKGQAYIDELEKKLSKTGMYLLLIKRWFYHKCWD